MNSGEVMHDRAALKTHVRSKHSSVKDDFWWIMDIVDNGIWQFGSIFQAEYC